MVTQLLYKIQTAYLHCDLQHLFYNLHICNHMHIPTMHTQKY